MLYVSLRMPDVNLIQGPEKISNNPVNSEDSDEYEHIEGVSDSDDQQDDGDIYDSDANGDEENLATGSEVIDLDLEQPSNEA